MCSSTRGPAMAPSFVTCLTSTKATSAAFASWISRSWMPDPCHGAGRAARSHEPHRLDRIDHHQRRVAGRGQAGSDVAQVDCGGELERRVLDAEAAGAQPGLLDGFLAGDVADAPSGARQSGSRLQQQRGFADAGVAADQDRRGRHQPSAQHAIQFGDAGGAARRRFGTAGQIDECEAPAGAALGGRAGARGDRLLDDAVPLFAGFAAAGPFRADRAAALTDKTGGGFGQGPQ